MYHNNRYMQKRINVKLALILLSIGSATASKNMGLIISKGVKTVVVVFIYVLVLYGVNMKECVGGDSNYLSLPATAQ